MKALRVIIVVLLIGGGVVAWRHLRPVEEPDDPTRIDVSGTIEVTDADLSFKIAGKVESRPVDEGERVKAGQPVAVLDSADLAQDIELRKAELAAAQASLAELEAGSRPAEIATAEAKVQGAQAHLDDLLAGARPEEIAAAEATVARAAAAERFAKAEADRNHRLGQQDVVPQRDVERTDADYERAVAALNEAKEQLKLVKAGPRKDQVAQARAALAQVQEQAQLVREGPRKETIEQARARVQQAKAALDLAKTRLGYAAIAAPFAGMVLSKNVEPGEYVAPGTPVVTMGDLEHVWLRAYINETDLGRVKLGQAVEVTTDTYPDKVYKGHISFIADAAEFTPKNVQTTRERVKLVYRVKIDIPNPDFELKPGMPADAVILTRGETP